MISELRIEHLGVIGQAAVTPGPGFTALTGETGTGKTMILTALGMLLGGRVDSAIAEGASVQGAFEVPAGHPALDLVADADDGEILLARTATGSRLRAFAGGRMVPAAVLSEIGELLVTVHGQASQQRLRSPAAQRAALDRFGGPGHQGLVSAHQQAYREWQQASRALEAAQANASQVQQRIVFLRAALEEIERIDPQPGETETLQGEAHRLTNLADLTAASGAASSAVLGDDDVPGAADLLHAAARQVQAADDLALGALHARLIAAAEEVSDIGRELTGFIDGLQDEPGRLEWIQQRLHDLGVVRSRYGEDEQAVLDWSQAAAAELVTLEAGDLQTLVDAQTTATRAWERAATDLTGSRRALAEVLSAQVTAELRELAMPNADLQVRVEPGQAGPDGRDEVTFLLSPHPGATPAPIGKAASGGELSRVMLALEVVLADTDTVGTFVFDEVDAGVGGAAATSIGRRLSRLAQRSQVIVVTHMPQVAAFASTHLRVIKEQDVDVTTSDVRVLTDEERVVEIARMLAGQEESQHAREHARELLAMV